jgi:adenosine deaminase
MGEKQDDAEVRDMLTVSPDRVGHCVFIDDAAREILRMRQVALEICITSNIVTGGLARASDHHVADWLRRDRNHPITVNTDDFGVFSTTLRTELKLFAEIVIDGLIEEDAEQRSRARLGGSGGAAGTGRSTDAALRAVFGELFRVQYNAARACFAPFEQDRARVIAVLDAAQEALWRQRGW